MEQTWMHIQEEDNADKGLPLFYGANNFEEDYIESMSDISTRIATEFIICYSEDITI
jgi:hypothetical protein